MEPLTRMLTAAQGDLIALTFCLFIAATFLVGVVTLFVPPVRASRFTNYLPSLMATVGLLGTFVGILVGLLDFDVADIDASVPRLLAGLQIAFVTSVAGISGSTLFRLILSLVPQRKGQGGVSPNDIYNVLSQLRDDGAKQAERQAQSLEAVRSAIAAEGDGSLLSQLQKLRTEQRDGQRELIVEFRDFAKHMTENNQRAIIEALREVISDFNQNLTEQFGENFKELNAAVHKLVDWQGNYRTHVDAVEGQIAAAVNALASTQGALAEVERHTSAIPESMRSLEPIIATLTVHATQLEAKLEALASLRQQAVEAFPVIERNLKSLTDDLTKHVETTVSRSGDAMQKLNDNHATLQKGYADLQEKADSAQSTFNQEMKKSLDAVNAQLVQTVTKHGDLIEANARDVQRTVSEAWDKTGKNIDDRIGALDQQMQEEMKRAIEAMGNRLASVSEKLASDYGPLTDKLSRVVRMAEGV